MTKRIGYVVLLLFLVGSAVAYGAWRERVIARLRDQVEVSDRLTRAAHDSLAVIGQDRARLLVRDSARAESTAVLQDQLAQRNRSLARRTSELDDFLENHAEAVPDTLVVLIRSRLAAADSTLAVCTRGWAVCERRVHELRDSIISRDTTLVAQLRTALDSTRIALATCQRIVSPPLSLPQLALKMGRYLEHGVAVMGAACIATEWLWPGTNESSPSNFQLYRPLDTRRSLIRVDLPSPWP